jgi:hypothetical protein
MLDVSDATKYSSCQGGSFQSDSWVPSSNQSIVSCHGKTVTLSNSCTNITNAGCTGCLSTS